MPILSRFYGIVIRMYFYDDKQHHEPHVHAEYAGEQAVRRRRRGGVGLAACLPAKPDWCRHGLKYIARNCWPIGNLP